MTDKYRILDYAGNIVADVEGEEERDRITAELENKEDTFELYLKLDGPFEIDTNTYKIVIANNWKKTFDEYNIKVELVLGDPYHRLSVKGKGKDIRAAIIDGIFSSFTDDDLQYEYDLQHGVKPELCGWWEY